MKFSKLALWLPLVVAAVVCQDPLPTTRRLQSDFVPHRPSRSVRTLAELTNPPRRLLDKEKLNGLVKKWLTPNGTNVGIATLAAGLLWRRSNKKANLQKIRRLKEKLIIQNLEFQNSESQRNELLRNIDLQLQQMGSRLESLRLTVGEKIDQFDGFVKARLGGLSYESYMQTYGPSVY